MLFCIVSYWIQTNFKLKINPRPNVRAGRKQVPMDFLRSLVGIHAKRGGSQECPNCGACKESVERVIFECAPLIPRNIIFLTSKRALTL